MTAPVAVPKIEALIERLASYTYENPPNAFELQRLEMQVSKEIRHFPAFAYTALGMIGLFENDCRKAEDAIRNALRLATGHPDVIKNAISILVTIGNVREAKLLIERIPPALLSDKEVLRCAILHSNQVLQFTKALHFIEKLSNLTHPNETDRMLLIKPQIEKHRELVNRVGLSEDDLMQRLETAIATIRHSGKDVCQGSFAPTGGGAFMYHLFVNANSKECADINFSIADALVENFEDPGSDVFSVMCMPISGIYGAGITPGLA